MKYIILLLFIATSLMGAPKEKQLVTPDAALVLLETIKDKAIVLGSGDKEIHSFIDPLCRMSQRYLTLLYKRNKELFSDYTIYLYLHEIKSKKSKKHILNIMDAESEERMLRAIMLGKEEFVLMDIEDEQTQKSFDEIADVAKKIGVFKRPYIMINGKAK